MSEMLSKLIIPNASKQLDFNLHNTKHNENTMQKTCSVIQLYNTEAARTHTYKLDTQIKITENSRDHVGDYRTISISAKACSCQKCHAPSRQK